MTLPPPCFTCSIRLLCWNPAQRLLFKSKSSTLVSLATGLSPSCFLVVNEQQISFWKSSGFLLANLPCIALLADINGILLLRSLGVMSLSDSYLVEYKQEVVRNLGLPQIFGLTLYFFIQKQRNRCMFPAQWTRKVFSASLLCVHVFCR